MARDTDCRGRAGDDALGLGRERGGLPIAIGTISSKSGCGGWGPSTVDVSASRRKRLRSKAKLAEGLPYSFKSLGTSSS